MPDEAVLTFTIRQTGDFTRKIGGAPGGRVRLEGPFGRLDSAVRERVDDARTARAGGDGAGIAPLTSLTAPCAEVWRIQLLWSIRRADDAYYSALLEE